jgi:chitodextrinase
MQSRIVRATIPLLILCVPVSVSAATFSMFETPHAAGPDPLAATATDLDGDGWLDLGIANRSDNSIHVSLNSGGSFTVPVRYGAGASPSDIVAADFDGDGRMDLAVSNELSDSILIFLGNGTGALLTPASVSTSSRPSSLAVGDYDADGRLDLAVTSRDSSSVLIHFNEGGQGFLASTSISVGLGPSSIHAVDLTRDGALDLVVANEGSDDVSALVNRGDGTFDLAGHFAVGAGPVSISSGDFDHDGRQDVIVSNGATDTLSILRNRGNGTFDPATHQTIGVDDRPRGIVGADLNQDGYSDIAVADEVDRRVEIFLNNGDGSFDKFLSDNVLTTPNDLVVGDFDMTGSPDILATNPSENDVWLVSNTTILVGPIGPASGLTGTGLDVDVYGSNFTTSCTVDLEDLSVNSTSFVSPTQLIASVEIGSSALSGHRDVTVSDAEDSLNSLQSGFLVISDPTPPTTPTGLAATIGSSTSVNLAWSYSIDPESGFAAHRIYRDGVMIAETGFNTFTDTGLAPGSSYSYRVSAVNTQEFESELSGEVCQTTTAPHLAPRLPCPGTVISAVGPGEVFVWNGGPNKKWQVQFSASSDFSVIQVRGKPAGRKWLKKTSWTPSNKKWRKINAIGAGGHPIFWRVMAKDAEKVVTFSPVFRLHSSPQAP